MDTANPLLSRVAYLMVVQRGEDEKYALLRRSFQGQPVEVLWDRRSAERRRLLSVTSGERRRSDRRASPPTSWNNLGFLVARCRASHDMGGHNGNGHSDTGL